MTTIKKIKKAKFISDFHNASAEHTLYWTGIFLSVFILLLYCFIYQLCDFFPVLKTFTVCQFKAISGIPCPSCGGTRACIYFFKGQWAKSIYYNAFGFYVCAVYTVFYLTQTLQRITKGKVKGLRWHDWFWKIGLLILAIQYLLKLCIPGYTI